MRQKAFPLEAVGVNEFKVSAGLGKAPKKGADSFLKELPHQQVQHVPGRNIFTPKTNS